MKICTNLHSIVTNRVWNILNIIDRKFLRDNINNLVACRYERLFLIIYQLFYFSSRYFIFRILPYYVSPCLQAFDMVTRDTHIYLTDLEVRIRFIAVIESLLNRPDGLFNIQHLSVLDTSTVSPTETENFELAVLIFPAGNRSNL